jgi:ribonuclease HI
MHGTVGGFAGKGPVVMATDAAYKNRLPAFGYVASDGRWGLERRHPGLTRIDPTGPSAVLVAELRAVAFVLEREAELPALLLIDSAGALSYLRSWQDGDTTRMPDGYSLRERWGNNSKEPTLVRLARFMADHPSIKTEHVAGHKGHPLNEAADALASLAWRNLPAAETRTRAEGLVRAFLAAWYGRHASLLRCGPVWPADR